MWVSNSHNPCSNAIRVLAGSGDKGNAKKDKVEAEDLTWVFPSRIAALEKFEGVTLPPALLGPTLLSLGAAPVIRKGAPTPKLPTITYLFPPNGLRVTLFYDPTKVRRLIDME